jgi:hypothetical protein
MMILITQETKFSKSGFATIDLIKGGFTNRAFSTSSSFFTDKGKGKATQADLER